MEKPNLRQRSSSQERCVWCHGDLDEGFTTICNHCDARFHTNCASQGCPTIGCSSQQVESSQQKADKKDLSAIETPEQKTQLPTSTKWGQILKSRPLWIALHAGVAVFCGVILLNSLFSDSTSFLAFLTFSIIFNIQYAIKLWRGEVWDQSKSRKAET